MNKKKELTDPHLMAYLAQLQQKAGPANRRRVVFFSGQAGNQVAGKPGMAASKLPACPYPL